MDHLPNKVEVVLHLVLIPAHQDLDQDRTVCRCEVHHRLVWVPVLDQWEVECR